MLDRTIIPPFFSPQSIDLPPIDSYQINRFVNLHTYQASNLEVFRLELVFRAGSYFDFHPGDAFFVSKLLNAGTKNKNSHQIAEGFDQYGGFLEISQGVERINITLHGMSRYFKPYFDLLIEILSEPIFPESELELQKTIALQNLQVNKEKTAFECSRIFRSGLFQGHNLGKSLNEEDINQIDRGKILNFWQLMFDNKGFDIFLCGNFDNAILKEIDIAFKEKNLTKNSIKLVSPTINSPFNTKIVKENSTQTSLRIGRRMINRHHPDFYKFMVTNTLLGGYFGSRLMKNIREDKGLTYGISSSLTPLVDDGIWSIGADVNKQNIELAIKEIEFEIEKLKNDNVPFEELDRVKNYMSGSILSSMNSPFDIMDKHKSLQFEGLEPQFYNEMIDKVKAVTAKEIKEISQKYFIDLSTVIVG